MTRNEAIREIAKTKGAFEGHMRNCLRQGNPNAADKWEARIAALTLAIEAIERDGESARLKR
jgi:hypothetical protein